MEEYIWETIEEINLNLAKRLAAIRKRHKKNSVIYQVLAMAPFDILS